MIAQNFLKILKGEKEAMSGIGSGKVIDRSVNLIVVSNIIIICCTVVEKKSILRPSRKVVFV